MALAARVAAEPALRRPQPSPRARRERRNRIRFHVARVGVRIAAAIALALSFLFVYVWMTAEVTAQSYRLHDDLARQSTLVQQAADLRQQVARLESLPRLESAAAALHMTEPVGVVVIAPPRAVPPPPRTTAIAASIADVRRWLTLR